MKRVIGLTMEFVFISGLVATGLMLLPFVGLAWLFKRGWFAVPAEKPEPRFHGRGGHYDHP